MFTLRRGNSITLVVGSYQVCNIPGMLCLHWWLLTCVKPTQAALEIMEKEGSSLVDRPRSISAGDTLSGGMRILLVGAGSQFRKLRRCVFITQALASHSLIRSSIV